MYYEYWIHRRLAVSGGDGYGKRESLEDDDEWRVASAVCDGRFNVVDGKRMFVPTVQWTAFLSLLGHERET